MSTKINNVLEIIDPSGLRYYLGAITPPQINELTFVPCVRLINDDILNVRPEGGYQREGEVKRMRAIKSFYSENLNSLIPPVLLSTRGHWKFTPKTAGSSFGSIEAEDCAAIIDGQHRLGGLSLLSQDDAIPEEAHSRTIPFMAVEFDSVATESEEFETINGQQKGIKASHLKYIRRNETFVGNVTTMLMEHEDSVFCGRIAISTRSDWDLITFKAASELIDATFDSYFKTNTRFDPSANEQNQSKSMLLVLEYWRLISIVFKPMWDDIALMPAVGVPKNASFPGRGRFKYRLLEETGLRAFAKLGSRILHRSWISTSDDVAWDNVERLLRQIASDERSSLVLEKLKAHNRDQILAVNAQLQFQGLAGVNALHTVLEGSLNR